MTAAFETTVSAPRRTAEILLRRLSRFASIDAAGRAALADLSVFIEQDAGDVLCDARRCEEPGFVVAGWVAWERWLPDHRRQIVRILIPGDSLALGEGPRETTGLRAVALTRVCLLDAAVLPGALAAGDQQWKTIAEALDEGGRRFERQMVDNVVRLGRQNAAERICHLMLELRERLRVVNLASDSEFPFPLTQDALADATGLSHVHVNRTLRQLRADGLLELRHGVAHLLDPDGVEILADYRHTTPAV